MVMVNGHGQKYRKTIFLPDFFDFVTYDEENLLTDLYGTIEVIPCWKWLLA